MNSLGFCLTPRNGITRDNPNDVTKPIASHFHVPSLKRFCERPQTVTPGSRFFLVMPPLWMIPQWMSLGFLYATLGIPVSRLNPNLRFSK